MKWIADSEGLDLLERSGCPFDTPSYREAVFEAYPRWRDASFAARADDGTVAAVALMKIAGISESPPLGYGRVVSSRDLAPTELKTFLDMARANARARTLRLRSIPDLEPKMPDTGGAPIGTTSVVRFYSGESWRSRADAKALYSLRRAEDLSAEVVPSANPAAFLGLYRVFADPAEMSPQRVAPQKVRHRDRLIEGVAANGAATFYEVVLEGEVVSATAVLKGAGHWMAWLGAQNERGRALHAGYVVLAKVLDDAEKEGVPAVNLGASMSAGGHVLDGVLRLKRRLGAIDLPIVEHVVGRRSARFENWVRARTGSGTA